MEQLSQQHPRSDGKNQVEKTPEATKNNDTNTSDDLQSNALLQTPDVAARSLKYSNYEDYHNQLDDHQKHTGPENRLNSQRRRSDEKLVVSPVATTSQADQKLHPQHQMPLAELFLSPEPNTATAAAKTRVDMVCTPRSPVQHSRKNTQGIACASGMNSNNNNNSGLPWMQKQKSQGAAAQFSSSDRSAQEDHTQTDSLASQPTKKSTNFYFDSAHKKNNSRIRQPKEEGQSSAENQIFQSSQEGNLSSGAKMVQFTVTKLIFNSSSSDKQQQLKSANTSSSPLSPPNDADELGSKVDSNSAYERDGKRNQKLQKLCSKAEETIGVDIERAKMLGDESMKEAKKCETLEEAERNKSQVPWSPQYQDNVPIIFTTDQSGTSGLRLSSSRVEKSQDQANDHQNEDDVKEIVSVFSQVIHDKTISSKGQQIDTFNDALQASSFQDVDQRKHTKKEQTQLDEQIIIQADLKESHPNASSPPSEQSTTLTHLGLSPRDQQELTEIDTNLKPEKPTHSTSQENHQTLQSDKNTENSQEAVLIQGEKPQSGAILLQKVEDSQRKISQGQKSVEKPSRLLKSGSSRKKPKVKKQQQNQQRSQFSCHQFQGAPQLQSHSGQKQGSSLYQQPLFSQQQSTSPYQLCSKGPQSSRYEEKFSSILQINDDDLQLPLSSVNNDASQELYFILPALGEHQDQNSENLSQLNNDAKQSMPSSNEQQLFQKNQNMKLQLALATKQPQNLKDTIEINNHPVSNNDHFQQKQQNSPNNNHSSTSCQAISEISNNNDNNSDDDDEDDDQKSETILSIYCGEESTASGSKTKFSKQQTKAIGIAEKYERQMFDNFEGDENHCSFEQQMPAMQMDRFIPCRTKDSHQAKWQASSQNQADFWAQKTASSISNTLSNQQLLLPSSTNSSVWQHHLQQASMQSQPSHYHQSIHAPSSQRQRATDQFQQTTQDLPLTNSIFGDQQQVTGMTSSHGPLGASQDSTAPDRLPDMTREEGRQSLTAYQHARGRESISGASGSDLPVFMLPSLDPLNVDPSYALEIQHQSLSSQNSFGLRQRSLALQQLRGGPSGSSQSQLNNPKTTASQVDTKMQQYHLLLEKSIFSEQSNNIDACDKSSSQQQLLDDQERLQSGQPTNLTTEIQKMESSSQLHGLSLGYQTGMMRKQSSQMSMQSQSSSSAAAHDSEDDCSFFYASKSQNDSQQNHLNAPLRSSKVLEFKKTLSNASSCSSNRNSAIELASQSEIGLKIKQKRSIISEYDQIDIIGGGQKRSTNGLFSQMNPLKSLDYITADSGSGIFVNKTRKISQAPYNTLKVPNLCDDFYLNLVDWSPSNILAVALAQKVYIWNANKSVSECGLVDLGPQNRVTSVSWSQKGTYLSVGTHEGQVQIWDVERQSLVYQASGHQNRVSSCAWSGNLLATGSKDKSIFVRDLRARGHVRHLAGHRQEVCGLRWSPFDDKVLASGGNDNKLMIWDIAQDTQPMKKFDQHQAAVKAINWSPLHRGLLATGGGTADQHIRFWNTQTLQPISAINTGSQVCNLVFSKTNDELVSTHGYSLNQVIVWKYPTMEKIATLTGHTYRVLYLAMSPDGSSIVTGAGDETLRFWNVFPKACTSSLYPSNTDFR